MRLIIEIDLDGAAFEEVAGVEAGEILREIAYNMDNLDLFPGMDWPTLRDSNGNTCGTVRIEED